MIKFVTVLWLGSYALAQDYLGCFRSTSSNPDLSTLILSRASSPAQCIKECRSRYYMFSGLMNGQQCYCGSKFGKNGLSTQCTITCATDPDNYCGGQEAISIYETGQKGPSPPRRIEAIRIGSSSLRVTWEPPDIPNGNVTLYALKAIVVETHSSQKLPPVESQVQGGTSHETILQGLQPGTKYNISITAANAQGSSGPVYTSEWTLIGPPNKPSVPKVIEETDSTVTVLLSEASSENGPVSDYQVLVIARGTIPPTGSDVLYFNYETSMKQGLGYYVTAEFESSEFPKYKRFTVGNGKMIGGYYNAPLNGMEYPQIGMAVISRFQREVRYAYSETGIHDSTREYEERTEDRAANYITILLWVAIGLLGALLFASVLVYIVLRQRHKRFRRRKSPEQQELTLQGPLYEVDNMAYIPEDVPERVNHYQELKNKVWTIPKNALTVDDTVIRRGRFGTVHTGKVLKEDRWLNVAVHSIADRLLKASEKRNMLRELDVCVKAPPIKYLAGLVGTCETPETLYVVLEMPPETLKARLLAARSGNIFPVEQILPMASAIAAALDHLENHKIVHTRLSARSVGLYQDSTPKLMGHGISRYSLEDIKYARWTAIECFNAKQKQKQQSAVVWAFGVLLWEMLSMGGTPYSNLGLESEVEEAVVGRGVRLPQLADVPDPLYEVMLSCWHVQPEERPTFAELTRLDTLTVCPITAITEPYIPEWELH